jgi:hypothetical protein
LTDPALAMVETASARNQDIRGSSPTAPEMRAPPIRHQKKAPLVAESPAARQIASSDRGIAQWSVAEEASSNASATELPPETKRPAQVVPRKNSRRIEVAEIRSSAKPRQATEWSEFPQDPRPSPLILRGRK